MGDVDVLDMLFDSTTGILGDQNCVDVQTKQKGVVVSNNGMDFFTDYSTSTCLNSDIGNVGPQDHAGVDSEWSSSFLNTSLEGLDHNEFFNALMVTNLPDDVKQQQQQLQQPTQLKQFSDHAYSIAPSSPHSDSGISNGPYSPSNSSNGTDELPFDIEQELFGPLDLKTYEDIDGVDSPLVDPMLLDSLSDHGSSPGLVGSESPISFDFEELATEHPAQSVKGLTISTDETTKVIKVLSVNGTHTTSLISNLPSKQKTTVSSNSPYPELTLSDEEKDLLRKEGISLPTHLPLTREEEKILRSVRRRIRNKASARNSRRKKQDYMEALEKRVKLCTDEKRQLQKKVNDLEKQNSTLIGQLKKLQKLVTDSTRQTARTGTCAMILALSFALVLFPNYQSLMGGNDSTQETSVSTGSCDGSGRPSRSLLSKPDDYITSVPQQEKSFSYIRFLNFKKMESLVSPAREPISDPVDGDREYINDPIDTSSSDNGQKSVSPSMNVDEKVIHMEITKIPDNAQSIDKGVENKTAKHNIPQEENIVLRRSIKMELDDEL